MSSMLRLVFCVCLCFGKAGVRCELCFFGLLLAWEKRELCIYYYMLVLAARREGGVFWGLGRQRGRGG